MIISEVIEALKEQKEKHGDIQVVQSCSKEGLLMPIRDIIGDEDVILLDDCGESYFHEIPPLNDEISLLNIDDYEEPEQKEIDYSIKKPTSKYYIDENGNAYKRYIERK